MRKSRILFFLICSLILVCTGCSTSISKSNDSGVIQCKRTGSIDGASSQMFYELYYDGEYLNILHSSEQVISSDEKLLDVYEDAYKNIYKAYDGLKYYDAKVIRDKDSVVTDVTINYEKIDIDTLLDIEGQEDNVIDKDGKVRLNTWLRIAEKFGVECK